MKRILWMICFLALLPVVNGQRSIDALFDRYEEREGFVTLTIKGDLLKLISCFDDDLKESSMPADITGIRILIQEDKVIKTLNFHDAVIKNLNLNDYEEFMRVKESDQDLRMLVRADGNRFKEFLLVAGGKDNFLIQIKGNMTFKEARKFSADIKNGNGVNIVKNGQDRNM